MLEYLYHFQPNIRGLNRTLRAKHRHCIELCHFLEHFTEGDEIFAVGGEHFVTENWSLLEVGDHVGARGTLFRTRTGELTLHIRDFELLSKALRPLPDKWHGLADKEVRYRQRYVDLIVNPEVREVFVRRSRIVSTFRRELESRGFLEVETPVLQPLYGGATARPFVTKHNALDMALYLRIADELYLKRLIVGGFDGVYEISKDFRNEGMDRTHNPEFTMLEVYVAYRDYLSCLRIAAGGASCDLIHADPVGLGACTDPING